MVHLDQPALRELFAVVHYRGTSHAFVFAVLNGHVAGGTAAEGGERSLPDTARVVEREVEMATEGNYLRVFREHVADGTGGPVIIAFPYTALRLSHRRTQKAAINRIFNHRMGVYDDEFLRFRLGDGLEPVVQPGFDIEVIIHRIAGIGRDGEDVVTIHQAVAAFEILPVVLIQIKGEVIVSQTGLHDLGLGDGIRSPPVGRVGVVVAYGIDHRHFCGIQHLLV